MVGRLLLFSLIIFFVSCASKKEVELIYIATPCNVEMPKRPQNKNDALQNTVEILKYVELLEESMKICRGG